LLGLRRSSWLTSTTTSRRTPRRICHRHIAVPRPRTPSLCRAVCRESVPKRGYHCISCSPLIRGNCPHPNSFRSAGTLHPAGRCRANTPKDTTWPKNPRARQQLYGRRLQQRRNSRARYRERDRGRLPGVHSQAATDRSRDRVHGRLHLLNDPTLTPHSDGVFP
jgi:hypothetical protein